MPSETRAAKRARLAEPEAEAEAEDPGKVGTGKIAAIGDKEHLLSFAADSRAGGRRTQPCNLYEQKHDEQPSRSLAPAAVREAVHLPSHHVSNNKSKDFSIQVAGEGRERFLPGAFPIENLIDGSIGSNVADVEMGKPSTDVSSSRRKRKYSTVFDDDDAEVGVVYDHDTSEEEDNSPTDEKRQERTHTIHLGTAEESRAQFEVTRLIPDEILIRNIDAQKSMNASILDAAAEYIQFLVRRQRRR